MENILHGKILLGNITQKILYGKYFTWNITWKITWKLFHGKYLTWKINNMTHVLHAIEYIDIAEIERIRTQGRPVSENLCVK